VTPNARARGSIRAADVHQNLGEYPGYCARPSCRKEIRRVATTGRPNRFCDNDCRRAAQTEQRTAEAKLRHMEGLVRQARADLATFSADDPDEVSVDVQRKAEVALAQAATALRYLTEPDAPGLRELRTLHDAVAPLIGSSSQTVSVA
jgi:hypothetical protein